MAVAFRAGATAGSASANSITCDKPTGTADGDVMLALVYFNSSTVTITAPSGWTALDTVTSPFTAKMVTYYKAASSEGSNYTWSFDATDRCRATIASFSGGSSTINAHTGQGNAASYYCDCAAITTTEDNCLLVMLSCVDGSIGNPWYPQGSLTERVDTADPASMGIADLTVASAGSSGAQQTVSAASLANGGFLIAIAPYTEPVGYAHKLFGVTPVLVYGITPVKVNGV